MGPDAMLPATRPAVAPAASLPDSAATGSEGARRTAIHQAAEDFEAMFLSQMLAPVFAELGKDSLLGGGPGEQVYRSMMVQEYGKAIAGAGGLGIADTVEREMLKLQELDP